MVDILFVPVVKDQ